MTGPVLRIINAVVRDRGMYICSAENPGGVAQASAIVEVERESPAPFSPSPEFFSKTENFLKGREPPAVELYPQSKQTIVQGGSALFQCRITAGIPTPKIKWSRVDGRPMAANVEELEGGVIRFVFLLEI